MKNLKITMIALAVAVASCKKGVDGLQGPKGAIGADGKNGANVTATGPAGDKGAVGDKGVTGSQGVISDATPSTIAASAWVKVTTWKSRETYDDKSSFITATIEAEVPMKILSAESIQKDVLLTYVRYTDKTGNQRNVLCNSLYFPELNSDVLLTNFKGYAIEKVILGNTAYIFRSDNLATGINKAISQLNAVGFEVRTLVIKSVVKGRMASVDFTDYESVCKTFNLNK